MAIIRFGHEDYDINKNDIILDDGSNYIIITKEIGSGLDSFHPIISKSDFNELRTHGMIYTNSELRENARENEKQSTAAYWKFRMDLINQYYGRTIQYP